MEKEAGLLIQEMKISLTVQKQAYAIFFVVILSLVYKHYEECCLVWICLNTASAVLGRNYESSCTTQYSKQWTGRLNNESS